MGGRYDAPRGFGRAALFQEAKKKKKEKEKKKGKKREKIIDRKLKK